MGTSIPRMSTLCSVLVGSGMYPIRFEIQMKKKSVATNGNQRRDISRDMLLRAIWVYARS